MYIQLCVKGIAGRTADLPGITETEAMLLAMTGAGITSNWWRNKGLITPQEIEAILTDENLDRHLHDYDNYGDETPFISLACGSVGRDVLARTNVIYSAIDTALMFATNSWSRPGALFYLWVPVSHRPAVALSSVAEPVRDLNIYQRWSPYQPEGEITAKVGIPANQIERAEWWDPTHDRYAPQHVWPNPTYMEPTPLSNIRELF